MKAEIFENNRENRYLNDETYQKLKNVCHEFPTDLNRILREMYTLTPHLEEEKILYLTDLFTEFLIFEKDLPEKLTSKILYTATCGFIPSLNNKVKREKSFVKTKALIHYKYHTILDNLDEIQQDCQEDEESTKNCEFGKTVLSFIGVSNPKLPNTARFLDENLL